MKFGYKTILRKSFVKDVYEKTEDLDVTGNEISLVDGLCRIYLGEEKIRIKYMDFESHPLAKERVRATSLPNKGNVKIGKRVYNDLYDENRRCVSISVLSGDRMALIYEYPGALRSKTAHSIFYLDTQPKTVGIYADNRKEQVIVLLGNDDYLERGHLHRAYMNIFEEMSQELNPFHHFIREEYVTR